MDIYTNEGYGTVLTNHSTATIMADLFMEKPFWTSEELNQKVGWQFSQGVFALRKKGWKINTIRLGHRKFGYKVESPEAQ